MKLESAFEYGDRLKIDNDHSIIGKVTAIKFGHSFNAPIYEISYVCNGECKSAWIEEFRLSGVEP